MKIPKNKSTTSIKFNPADFDPIRKVALTFPGAEESVSHENTPSIKVNGKLLCRLHDDGQFIPIRIGFEYRDEYIEKYPDIFHVPAHFKNYPYICMWVPQSNTKLLKEIVEVAWKQLATKKQLKERDQHEV